jgi:hypothetical protein
MQLPAALRELFARNLPDRVARCSVADAVDDAQQSDALRAGEERTPQHFGWRDSVTFGELAQFLQLLRE